ncbi:MAG: hypothetical protein IPM17_05395 [Verrucomicrobia bacterium]|jgi:hypothetical protein|nr:hypothetical protein [Verrucomicrobiota bacterium]
MAWRIADWVTHGEWDNRQRGRVFGWLWMAARKEPLSVEVTGNACRDLAGCFLAFRRRATAPPAKPAPSRAILALMRRGVAGAQTASRRIKVPALPEDEVEIRRLLGLEVPTRLANALSLEWYSDQGERIVLESLDFDLQISTPLWNLTVAEEERQRQILREFLARVHRRSRNRGAGPAADEAQSD